MNKSCVHELRPGDFVEVRSAAEILSTLDADGCLKGLPFMPEMLEFIGRRFKVFRRLEKTCVEGSPAGFGRFHNDDVVFLEGLRCNGASHDGCGRACMIFWKEAWLSRVDSVEADKSTKQDPAELKALAARLRAPSTGGKYFCQSTNLTVATNPLSTMGRLSTAVRDVSVGTYTLPRVLKLVFKPMIGKILLRFRHRTPPTNRTKTPKGQLGLVEGDWVEVKSVEEIAETLDIHGRNRGLVWSYDLKHYCGRRFRVAKRLDRIIVEYNADMVNMSDTVLLEGAHCPCKYAVGGCPRSDLIYWREIWLKRVEPPAEGTLAKNASATCVKTACCTTA